MSLLLPELLARILLNLSRRDPTGTSARPEAYKAYKVWQTAKTQIYVCFDKGLRILKQSSILVQMLPDTAPFRGPGVLLTPR